MSDVHHLRCFGFPHLVGPCGRRLEEMEHHPKRFAILIYLACHTSTQSSQREALLPVFWPEADEAHARNALRQSVHWLRQRLGPGVLLGRDDQLLALDPSRFRADVWDFRDHIREKRWDQARGLHTGSFLEGFGAPECEPFLDWADTTASELRSHALQAWTMGAVAAEAKGDLGAASRAWSRALACAPYSESSLRGLVRAHVASGERALAAHAVSRFARRLRADLQLELSPDTVAFVEAALGPRGVRHPTWQASWVDRRPRGARPGLALPPPFGASAKGSDTA